MKNLNQIVQDILKDKGIALNVKEIVSIIKSDYSDFYNAKMKRTEKDDKETFLQFCRELYGHYDQLKKYNVYKTVDSPQKYYYSSEEDQEDASFQCNNNESRSGLRPEFALYPLFLDYCKGQMGIEAMRLDENKSQKNRGKGTNEWKHPDIIGYKDLVKDFEHNTKLFMADCPCEKFDLYSFEIKDQEVTNSNLKEWFFQTVSNSSWANYSYLVAEGIKNTEVLQELELLCTSYKIGFIKFKREEVEDDLSNGKILIHAPRTNIDWNMIDRLAKLKNDDFNKYLKTLIELNQHHKNQNSSYPNSFYSN